MKWVAWNQRWRTISNQLIDGILFCVPYFKRPKTLLLVRLDAIGDYVLFRNFIKEVATSEQYRDYTIDLCGNKDWRELAETCDKEFVRGFIWIDRRQFKKNTLYKLWKMVCIRLMGYDVVIESRYSREYVYGDQIVKAAGAKESIGSVGDLGNITAEQKQITDQYYSRLISADDRILFEFDRNKEFFEGLLGRKIDLSKPVIDADEVSFPYYIEPPYVVIFPGGSGPQKRWNHRSFARMADLVSIGYEVQVVIVGSPSEEELCQLMLMYPAHRYKFINLCGLTNLSGLAKVLSDASLLISNETCAIHFAVAVDTPSVCIANGNNIFRFTEYSDEVFDGVDYIYPRNIQQQLHDRDRLAEKYKHNTHGNIFEVEYEDVCQKVMHKMEQLGFTLKNPQEVYRYDESSH